MQDLLGNLIGQFREYTKALSPVKRNSLLASVLVGSVGISIVVAMVSGTHYKPLFTNVASDQLPLIVEKLQKRNVPFDLQDDGKTITVPEELLHATQMAIMAELGNTKVGNTGLEMFAKQDFGVTSYAQRINYQRALQGELMRSINTLTAIKQSKVLLAIPPKKTFLEESGEPTASVVVELNAGKTLTEEQVKGITYLVAASVEKLVPEKVTVVDSRGKVLSKQYSAEGVVSAELLDLKKKVEAEFEESIESMLSRVVGTGKVIAKVNATLNPRHTSSVEELVDADSSAVRSQQSEEELLDGARNNPAGIPGARANLPGAEDQGQVGFRQNVRREIKTLNYSVPKTVKRIREAAGDLERVTVAVLVDGVMTNVTNEKGDQVQQWQERSAADLVKYENIVKNAIGFNASRGDSVKIENIQFEKEDFKEAEELLTNLERRQLLRSLLKWSLLGFALAMFFFIVVRPFMRWVTDSFQDTVEDMLPRTIEELEDLQSVDNTLPGMSGALPVLEEAIDPNKAESELLKERIVTLMGEDVEKSTAAMNLWLSRRDL
ncbi:MAG: flagellar M-ring protein FliF [Pseudobdellovibrionaceae bacterium]|nr:flagellar M-ring protein FliF [Bdellovibrionales bacterium]USN47284.1 MAG: flagellar M-ring protein FliF [Pseudobdellovibrionaceae bacterium]